MSSSITRYVSYDTWHTLVGHRCVLVSSYVAKRAYDTSEVPWVTLICGESHTRLTRLRIVYYYDNQPTYVSP